MTLSDWIDIERDARMRASADLARIEAEPLVAGTLVAWAECRHGKTDGFSSLHRIASTGTDDERRHPETYCGEPIPAPLHRLALTPGWIRTQPRCRICEQRAAADAWQGAA